MAEWQTEAQRKFYQSQTKLAEDQSNFIKSQKEFIQLQKEELIEGRKDRKSINKFTFVLAFGVIISLFSNLFQISIQLKQSTTLHMLVISSLFTLLFAFFISSFMGKT